ncbi:MAG: helix-turn-helix domain-containing protein [bacterium]
MLHQEEHRQITRLRRKRERDYRVQSILEAARKVFFARGYMKATMEEIATLAEVSKPAIYHYFRTKDELFFSLMVPVVDHFQKELNLIEKRLLRHAYKQGQELVSDLFRGFFRAYKKDPDGFQVVQLFQQTGMVGQLEERVGQILDQKGAQAFRTARRIMSMGMDQGLLKPMSVFSLADAFWGFFVGVVQLERIKSKKAGLPAHLRSTLLTAEKIFGRGVTRGENPWSKPQGRACEGNG